MENFEVRAKSFTIKWVNAPDFSTIQWELKPLKRSINFSIYRYNKTDNSSNNLSIPTNSSSSSTVENLSLDEVNSVPHKMFSELHQSMRDSFDSTTSTVNSPSTVNGSGFNEQGPSTPSATAMSLNQSTRKRGDSFASISSSNSNSAGGDNSMNSTLEEKLDKHLVKERWIGRCEGDQLVTGKFEVATGGLFAFVFDNTFSKHKAKKIRFHQYIESEANENKIITLSSMQTDGQLHTITEDHDSALEDPESTNATAGDSTQLSNDVKEKQIKVLIPNTAPPQPTHVQFSLPAKEQQPNKGSASIFKVKGGQYLQGFLMKKKRRRSGAKKFSKRFFVLNFKYGALDYYLNDMNNRIRGNMYIKNVIISADAKQLMFYLDSGIEQWVLKAFCEDDFNVWVQAFNFIKKQNKQDTTQYMLGSLTTKQPVGGEEEEEEEELDVNEPTIDGLLKGDVDDDDDASLDDARPGRSSSIHSTLNPHFRSVEERISSIKELSENLLNSAKPVVVAPVQEVVKKPSVERRGSLFWKKNRKERDVTPSSTPQLQPPLSHSDSSIKLAEKIRQLEIQYQLLMNTETNRGFSRPPITSPTRRVLSRTDTTATSVMSQEFVDAQEYIEEMNQVVHMVNSSDHENDDDDYDDEDDEFDFEVDSNSVQQQPPPAKQLDEKSATTRAKSESNIFDSALSIEKTNIQSSTDDDLYPLGFEGEVHYRDDIKASVSEPPSLISFLRKNIGKDLSTISMPVSANEPLTFLQKYCESFEYSNLLTEALNSPMETGERILKIACFSISYLSSYRAKVRNSRKPFNPLLGESYELVRKDLGIRVVTEKVVHRPAVFAAHVDSKTWTIDHVLSPMQRIGGKSAEVSIKGEVIMRCSNGEVYRWTQPITLLKNLIAGEKYSEPYSSITVSCNNGYSATASFKAGGMFAGRSEELEIKAKNPQNHTLPLSVTGTWTEELKFQDTNKTVWKASPLVKDDKKKFGFTKFAATLNDISEIDRASAPTDSRWRPDQREYENGNLDEAEKLKVVLEEEQRKRRKDSDGKPAVHTPAFFKKVGEGELDWEYVSGEKGYWARRKQNNWDGLLKLW
ncbi:hypothetical protein CANARDRAFT_196112 [[Candida] arabinofermentans NRRL YB-2248]|uniref:PH domain-containing protein n=1 Tax=[Candida] arabinofermentans NRRL YB-2248 TaxID=983967 RepID=A0A1E4T4P0_9ASCO|nr:hypothetical protein CANARDRAFT_196112 [[Candida] arabinofermentans NRRL YB-2248]